MTRYYVDAVGSYIGGFSMPPDDDGNEMDHPDVPEGAVEVPTPPENAGQVWDGTDWGAEPPQSDPRFETDAQAIEATTSLEELKSVVAACFRKL